MFAQKHFLRIGLAMVAVAAMLFPAAVGASHDGT